MSAQETRGARVRPDLVDRMLELYCDWRTECSAVQSAYECFSLASGSDRELAFAAYSAALDREGSAAERYATQVRLVASLARDSTSPVRPRATERR